MAQQQLLPRKRRCCDNLDRFIPNRYAMNFDFARYAFAEAAAKKSKITHADPSPSPYRKRLAEVLDMNRTRILEFKDKPKPPTLEHHHLSSFRQSKPTVKRPRKIPQSSDRTLDAPGLRDDYYLNLIDWGTKNVLAVAIETEVYLWDGFNSSTHHLMSSGNEHGHVTSVTWAPDGHHIAIGLENSDVQLWDAIAEKHIRTLRGGHQPGGVGSLDWNIHILTTGGTDGQIFNNDVRIRSHVTATYTGHYYAVCGLKWSSSGKLASGGNDNLLHIWDRSMATRWLHRFEDHRAAVKALAWCPFQSNLLASGGGSVDCCIKFWNTNTGRRLNSIDTGSQVCSLLWNTNERELLSSHGFRENQLTLWKYPSMVKITELMGHTSRILFMAQSPDGSTVATAAGAIDETIRFWNVFGTPEKTKAAPKTKPELFPNMNRIR